MNIYNEYIYAKEQIEKLKELYTNAVKKNTELCKKNI